MKAEQGTTDTFTDAMGWRYIAGQVVPEEVWERFAALEVENGRLRAFMEAIVVAHREHLRTGPVGTTADYAALGIAAQDALQALTTALKRRQAVPEGSPHPNPEENV